RVFPEAERGSRPRIRRRTREYDQPMDSERSRDERLERVERLLGELTERVGRLEAASPATAAVAPPPEVPPAPAVAVEPVVRAPQPTTPVSPAASGGRNWVMRPGETFEDLLGGRILAVVGGLAILVGVVFFLVIAVDRGWIGVEARVALA